MYVTATAHLMKYIEDDVLTGFKDKLKCLISTPCNTTNLVYYNQTCLEFMYMYLNAIKQILSLLVESILSSGHNI